MSPTSLLDTVQVVVVLSGSMEPAFYRGDILFLHMGRKPLVNGEVRRPSLCTSNFESNKSSEG